jgi:aryl-alcohol dehydrogenase-like predicted oxidoreductase
MRALEKLADLGKIRFLGVSNYPIALIEEARSCLSKIDITFIQYRYNLIERQAEIELIPYAEKNNMIFLPWSPLAKGALTGKYILENLPEFKDVRNRDPIFHPENFKQIQKLVDVLKELSSKYDKSPAQISLNWLIMYSKNIVPIPGAKNPDQVRSNAGSVGWRLSYDDWRLLDEISKSIRISYATWYVY